MLQYAISMLFFSLSFHTTHVLAIHPAPVESGISSLLTRRNRCFSLPYLFPISHDQAQKRSRGPKRSAWILPFKTFEDDSISSRKERGTVIITSSSMSPFVSSALSIRGGDIQIIQSLSEVEDVIQSAAAAEEEEEDNDGSNNNLVVVYFTANNCPPCKMISPIYSDLSNLDEFVTDRKVQFLKVNVNDCPDVASKYGVDGWPTFLLFQNGRVVDSIVGGMAARDGLYDLVSKYA